MLIQGRNVVDRCASVNDLRTIATLLQQRLRQLAKLDRFHRASERKSQRRRSLYTFGDPEDGERNRSGKQCLRFLLYSVASIFPCTSLCLLACSRNDADARFTTRERAARARGIWREKQQQLPHQQLQRRRNIREVELDVPTSDSHVRSSLIGPAVADAAVARRRRADDGRRTQFAARRQRPRKSRLSLRTRNDLARRQPRRRRRRVKKARRDAVDIITSKSSPGASGAARTPRSHTAPRTGRRRRCVHNLCPVDASG